MLHLHLLNAAETARAFTAEPPPPPPFQAKTPPKTTSLDQSQMMFTFSSKKRKRDRFQAPVPPPAPVPHSARADDRKTIRVSIEVHQALLEKAQAAGKSIEHILESFLTKTPSTSTFIPRGAGSSTGIALLQMSKLKDLQAFLHCPIHRMPMSCSFSVRGQSPYIKMTCPSNESCRHVFWGTDLYDIGGNKNKYSKSMVANQLGLAAATQNSSYGEYRRLCQALALAPLSRTYYHHSRTRILQEVAKIWEIQEPVYQELAQKLDDRNLEMDGSYSQRRNAEHCFVNLLTSNHHLIVLSAVGSRKELHTSSQGLEQELCTQAVIMLSNSPLKPKSITHDEHTGVTKMMSDLRHLLPDDFEERHDGWHRKKNVSKYLPNHLAQTSLGLSSLKIEDICNKVLMYMNSAFYKHTGDPEGFGVAIAKISSFFSSETEAVKGSISQFFADFFPSNRNALFVSNTSTSTLEAFNGHHHQFVGKARYLNLYRERTYLHNLIWNSARLRDLQLQQPLDPPAGLLLGDDWLRSLQGVLGLVILPKDSLKAARKTATRREKVANRALQKQSAIQSLLDAEESPWRVISG